MYRRSKLEELAGLLDGELDAARTEQLYAELKDDPQLQAEFRQQREIKALLGQLPEYQAPDYLATRVLGHIGARRDPAGAWRWRTLAAAVGGFALCVVLASALLYFNRTPQPGYLSTRPVGDLSQEYASEGLRTLDRSMSPAMGGLQLSPDWREFAVPANTDDKLTDFLQFANKAHYYSTVVNATEAAKPDLPSAILVLDGKVYILEEAEAAREDSRE